MSYSINFFSTLWFLFHLDYSCITCNAFINSRQVPKSYHQSKQQHSRIRRTSHFAGKGFATLESPTQTTNHKPISIIDTSSSFKENFSEIPPTKLKQHILSLVARTTGKREELEEISALVNALEDKYSPIETSDFMNLAMAGDWQMMFTTNRLNLPDGNLRLRELFQRVEPDGTTGTITNVAEWDWTEDPSLPFQFSGSLSIKSSYGISSYPRLQITLEDHILKPNGKPVPSDIEGLFQGLHRAIPMELFDPNQLGMDTTYLDDSIRIVRYTGDRCERVRNIFMRKGAFEVDPGMIV